MSGEFEARLQELKAKYPGVPEHCLPLVKRGKKQSPANQLTDECIRHIKSLGGCSWRISAGGQFDTKQGRWRPGGQKRGLPDVIGILPDGRFIGIEVEVGRDRVSEYQELRRSEIISSNGHYLIARNLEKFKNELKQIIERTHVEYNGR